MIIDEREALAALAAGEVVAVPTDTVYGLAVDPSVASATARLFAVKGRPETYPLPVLVPAREVAELLGVFDPPQRRLLERFWPGALTVVVSRRPAASGFELGGDPDTIGLRCPAHRAVSDLFRRAGPLAVTSANRHGQPPCHSAEEVLEALGGSLKVLDGGICDGEPSTVVLLGRGGARCLRKGAVAIDEVELVLTAGAGREHT